MVKFLVHTWKFLQGKKTYIVSAVGVVYALSGAFLGHLSWTDATMMIQLSLTGAGLRNGVANQQ